jgi:predicted PurR-regulated permease PerM
VQTLSHDAPHHAAGAASFITQHITVLAVTPARLTRPRVRRAGLSLTGRRQQRYRQAIIDIKDAVARYALGNITISVLATGATWIVLSILGVSYAPALGLVVGFFDFIPLSARRSARWPPSR